MISLRFSNSATNGGPIFFLIYTLLETKFGSFLNNSRPKMYGSTENACPELEHLQFGPTGVYLKYH